MSSCQNHGWHSNELECPTCLDAVGTANWRAPRQNMGIPLQTVSRQYHMSRASHKMCTYAQCQYCGEIPMALREAIVEIRDLLAKLTKT